MLLQEDQIANLLDNKLTAEELDSLIKQIDECEECLYQIAGAIKLRSELKNSFPPALPNEILKRAEKLVKSSRKLKYKRVKKSFRRWQFAVAFALSVFIGLFIYRGFSNVNIYRANNSSSKVVLVSPKDMAVFNLSTSLFKWKPKSNCNYYLFVVYTPGGKKVFSKALRNNSIRHFGNFHFKKGSEYLWQVTAVLFNGQKIKSNLNAFVVGE